MSDDLAPAVEQDTPPSAPEEGHAPQADDPYKQRYEDLRPEFDRKSQTLSQYEEFFGQLTNEDPETRARALAALNLEPVADENEQEEGYYDPNELFEQRVAALEAEREAEHAQAQEEAQAQAYMDYVHKGIKDLEQEVGRELTPKEAELLTKVAYASPDPETGWPDVRGGFDALEDFWTSRQKAYVENKKKTPRVPDGQSAEQAFDLSTPEGRIAAGTAKYESLADDVER